MRPRPKLLATDWYCVLLTLMEPKTVAHDDCAFKRVGIYLAKHIPVPLYLPVQSTDNTEQVNLKTECSDNYERIWRHLCQLADIKQAGESDSFLRSIWLCTPVPTAYSRRKSHAASMELPRLMKRSNCGRSTIRSLSGSWRYTIALSS